MLLDLAENKEGAEKRLDRRMRFGVELLVSLGLGLDLNLRLLFRRVELAEGEVLDFEDVGVQICYLLVELMLRSVVCPQSRGLLGCWTHKIWL